MHHIERHRWAFIARPEPNWSNVKSNTIDQWTYARGEQTPLHPRVTKRIHTLTCTCQKHTKRIRESALTYANLARDIGRDRGRMGFLESRVRRFRMFSSGLWERSINGDPKTYIRIATQFVRRQMKRLWVCRVRSIGARLANAVLAFIIWTYINNRLFSEWLLG